MANSFSASSLCPDLCRAVASVMDFGISRHESLCSTQWGDCLFVPLERNKRESPAQISLREVWVELCSLREPGDRLVPFLVTASKFSQDIFCARIARIDLQL